MHLDFGFLAEERFQKEEHLFRRQEAGGLQDPSNSTANITFPFTQPRQQLWPASLPVGGNQSIQVRYVSQLGEKTFCRDRAFTKHLSSNPIGDDDYIATCVKCVLDASFTIGASFDVGLNLESYLTSDDTRLLKFDEARLDLRVNKVNADFNVEVYAALQFSQEASRDPTPEIPQELEKKQDL